MTSSNDARAVALISIVSIGPIALCCGWTVKAKKEEEEEEEGLERTDEEEEEDEGKPGSSWERSVLSLSCSLLEYFFCRLAVSVCVYVCVTDCRNGRTRRDRERDCD